MLASCCLAAGVSSGTHSLRHPPAPPALHQAGPLVWYGLWVQSPPCQAGLSPIPTTPGQGKSPYFPSEGTGGHKWGPWDLPHRDLPLGGRVVFRHHCLHTGDLLNVH